MVEVEAYSVIPVISLVTLPGIAPNKHKGSEASGRSRAGKVLVTMTDTELELMTRCKLNKEHQLLEEDSSQRTNFVA